MALSGFSDFDELSSCETLLYHNGLSAISFTHVFDRKKTDLCSQSLHTSDVPSRKTRSSVIMDDEKSVTSNSRLVLPHSKPSFRVNHEDRLMLADSFLSPDAHPAAVRKLRGRRRRGKQNLSNCSSISPLRLDQSGLLQTSSFESGTVESVGAVVPVMVGRRRGRRGTVRGNVGSGESFSPLRLSESVLAEPVVEKGSVNGDASSVSGCSVLPVSESKAVCVLTAMDLKLTEGGEEEKSMSMNGDLNPLVSSQSISSPDRGGTVESVGAVVPVMVGRRRGRRGTVRGNVGSGESFSPLRLSESVLAEPVVEKGSSFSENEAINFHLASLPINVTASSSTVPQSISAIQQPCSVKCTASKRRRLLGEQDRISALMSLNELEEDCKSEAHRISSKTRLSRLTYSRGSSDSQLHPETVDSILPSIKPVSIVIADCFLESEEDDNVDSMHLVKKCRKSSVVLDEVKNDSSDNSETLEPPVSSLQALSPIPYRYEDDVVIPEVVASDGAKHASSGGMVMLKPPVSSLQALSPIPYRYEDDVGMPEGVFSRLLDDNNLQKSSRSFTNLPIIPRGRPSVTFAPIVVYFDSSDNSKPRVSVGPIAHDESDLTHFECELSEKLTHQEGSLTQSENKENIGSFFESTALSSVQDSKYPSPSTSSLSLSRIKLPWCTPYDCQFLPFKSKRPPTKSFIQSDGQLRRSKRLRVPATHDRNKVVVYEPDKDEYGLVYQKPIGLAILPDPDEMKRRQKFLNRLKHCQNNRTQFLKNERINRAKRLQKLAKRYRSLKGAQKRETDPCMRIQLDPDVEWTSHTETQLPIGTNDASPFQQVIYPENAQFSPFKFSTMEYSSYVVPALSGAFPSRTKTRIPCFEVDANLTRIVSKEQERRQLHYDPNAINVFKMMSSPPVLMNNNSSLSVYAVQIAKFAIPLTKPCIVYIPKGIPYKFLNATKENLNLCRIRYVLT